MAARRLGTFTWVPRVLSSGLLQKPDDLDDCCCAALEQARVASAIVVCPDLGDLTDGFIALFTLSSLGLAAVGGLGRG
jgi:hypothetical protein